MNEAIDINVLKGLRTELWNITIVLIIMLLIGVTFYFLLRIEWFPGMSGLEILRIVIEFIWKMVSSLSPIIAIIILVAFILKR